MSRVGILGFQGCIEPHEGLLKKLQVESVRVKSVEDLSKIDRIILPGGESSTMIRLIESAGMWEELNQFVRTKPTWGICAGAILLAEQVTNPDQKSFAALPIKAHRNFYGGQLFSFSTTLSVSGIADNLMVDFIRAPALESLNVAVEELAKVSGQTVFFRYQKIWASSFHVELREDLRLHQAFLAI